MAKGLRVVGVRELRQNLSVYLERIKDGEALTVTEHGRAIAELRPLGMDTDPLARLIKEGAIAPPRRRGAALPRPMRMKTGRRVSELLDELRDERL